MFKGNCKFDIQVPGRLYSFQARTEEEMSGWVQEINKVITRFSETPTCQEALRKLAPNRPISAILQVDSKLVVASEASVRIVDHMVRCTPLDCEHSASRDTSLHWHTWGQRESIRGRVCLGRVCESEYVRVRVSQSVSE